VNGRVTRKEVLRWSLLWRGVRGQLKTDGTKFRYLCGETGKERNLICTVRLQLNCQLLVDVLGEKVHSLVVWLG
jgi:hypothetical protein